MSDLVITHDHRRRMDTQRLNVGKSPSLQASFLAVLVEATSLSHLHGVRGLFYFAIDTFTSQ